MRRASVRESASSPAIILSSTVLTATVAFARLLRPSGVSSVGSTLPTGAAAGLVTKPSRSSAWTSTFIDCRETKVPRASSELDSPGRCDSSSRHE